MPQPPKKKKNLPLRGEKVATEKEPQIKISRKLFDDIFTYFRYFHGFPMSKEEMLTLRERIMNGLEQKMMAEVRRANYMQNKLATSN